MSTNRETEHRDRIAYSEAWLADEMDDGEEYGSAGRPCGMVGCPIVLAIAILLAVAIPLVVTVAN